MAMLTYVSCSEEPVTSPTEQNVEVDKAHNNSEQVKGQRSKGATSTTGDVPFAVVEEVPVFPGCETLDSREERKTCMSQKINEFVNINFNTSLGKELSLTGIHRIYVQFKIAKDGDVEFVGARAPHPALEEEAERVVKLLPNMTPGKQNGEEVAVLYTLPITFKISE